MNREFWQGRRVLITGHTGFKGSWLIAWLRSLGAEVYGFATESPTDPALFEAAGMGRDITSTIGDIRDAAAVQELVAEIRPEIVLHLAARAVVRESYQNPVETYAVNVMGVAHILDAVRSVSSVRAVVVVTSDKCYSNREWVWGYREDEPMGGHDPYSSSKGCAELVTAAYVSSYFSANQYGEHGVAVASARAGNVIGGGDWALDRLVPDIVRSFHAGVPVVVRNPDAVRPWQFVLEPLRGYLMLAEALFTHGPKYAGGWNFGPSEEDVQPVSWITERAVNIWGEDARWEVDSGTHPHEANYLKLDCSKSKSALGWRPVLQLPRALDWTVGWYRDYYHSTYNNDDNSDVDAVRDLVMQNIARYEELLPC